MARGVLVRAAMGNGARKARQLKRLIRVAYLTATLLIVLVGWAQTANATLTVSMPSRTINSHADSPYAISYADCTGNDQFTFSVSSTDTTTGKYVEVWVTDGT